MSDRRRADSPIKAPRRLAKSLRAEAWCETKDQQVDLGPTAEQMAQDKEVLTEAAQSLNLLYITTGKQVFKDALDEMHAICMAKKSDVKAMRKASQIPMLDAMMCYAIKRNLDSGRSFCESLEHLASRIDPEATSVEGATQKLKRIWMKWGERGAQAGCVYCKTMGLIDWYNMQETLHLFPLGTHVKD